MRDFSTSNSLSWFSANSHRRDRVEHAVDEVLWSHSTESAAES